MTIRHLQIFIVVAEEGKMGAAAAKLFISQPTVSKVIAEIEENYGIKLFERLSQKLYITEAGKQLLSYAKHIVNLFNEMEKNLRDTSDRLNFKVGATITVGNCVMANLISSFEALNPNINVQVIVDNTEIIENMILQSNLDLAIVEGVVKSPDIIVTPVIHDELILVCGMNHPFSEKEEISITELEGQPFVLRELGSGTRAIFDKHLKQGNVAINEKWICHDFDSILKAVIEGQGLSVLSKYIVQNPCSVQKLHQLKIKDIELCRTFNLIHHKNKYISAPLQSFIQELKNYNHFGS